MFKTLKNRLRKRRLARAGVAVEIPCETARYGTGGGAWTACPEGLDRNSVIYSFGIGRDLSFDRALIDRHAVTVHAFDPTPTSVQWARSQTLPPALTIHEFGLAHYNGDLEFHAPRKATSAHFTPVQRYRTGSGDLIKAPVRRLRTIMRELGHERVDLLKMDIEGGEYDVIADIVNEGIPITQFLVEFHHNYETIPFQKTVDAVFALRRVGFKVFAISARTYEVSMLRK